VLFFGVAHLERRVASLESQQGLYKIIRDKIPRHVYERSLVIFMVVMLTAEGVGPSGVMGVRALALPGDASRGTVQTMFTLRLFSGKALVVRIQCGNLPAAVSSPRCSRSL
jgi:hypothetical protein